eukprot:CAMPEP_0181397004 /NCGR_PEP_ID=MMETSP1110-20121109/232_1 /TAXON_ID=174948 /ORGANISM="Symbiodinium sp., Strain CCMP421" /LENGTH=83 /DNA_ID=CAMNT_0023518771 /DNA_START=185 /DNA_END=433 /DNA_ORIENTATION=-
MDIAPKEAPPITAATSNVISWRWGSGTQGCVVVRQTVVLASSRRFKLGFASLSTAASTKDQLHLSHIKLQVSTAKMTLAFPDK